MMRETPRTFVGPVVFLLDAPFDHHVSAVVQAEIGSLPGVSSCSLDAVAGALVVTAEGPVERTDVMTVLDRLGCRVRA